MSDHIAMLNVGVIHQGGSSREVYEHPVNVCVARFMDHDESAAIWMDSLTGLPVDETHTAESRARRCSCSGVGVKRYLQARFVMSHQ